MAAAALLPRPVAPPVAVDGVELAVVSRARFGVEGVGIGLPAENAVGPGDGEFIGIVGLSAGNKALPDPAGDLLHGMGAGIPGIEITHHGNGLCPRRPDAEHIAGDSVMGDRMRAHIFIGIDSRSFMEKVGIQFICFSVGHSVPPFVIMM